MLKIAASKLYMNYRSKKEFDKRQGCLHLNKIENSKLCYKVAHVQDQQIDGQRDPYISARSIL